MVIFSSIGFFALSLSSLSWLKFNVGKNIRLAYSGCWKGWRFLLSILTEKQKAVQLSASAKNENTVLTIACHKQTTVGHVKIIKSILSDEYVKYCDVNKPGLGGRSALYRCCQMGHIAALRLLLKLSSITLNAATDVNLPSFSGFFTSSF